MSVDDYITVPLQPPFSYSKYFLIILFLVIALIVLILILLKIKEKVDLKRKDEPALLKKNPLQMQRIKSKYLGQMNKLEDKVKGNKITIRHSYQRLSKIIRGFIGEITNIKIENYTLTEIKNLNIPILYQLVKEYYAPEFAKEAKSDILKSIEKTRITIEKWH